MKKNIQKVLISLFALIYTLGVNADGLTINNINTVPGATPSLSVSMNNTTNTKISALQFDLVLPTGVTLSSATVNATRKGSFAYTVDTQAQSDGSIRIVCMSQTDANAVFTGTSGEVLKLNLNVSNSASTGNRNIQLKNQLLTTSTLTEVSTSTYSTSLHIHALTRTAATAATCTTTGNNEYWRCSSCSKVYTTSSATTQTTVANQTLAALGHSYGSPAWTWSDYTSATVKKSCTRTGCTHSVSATASITNAITTAATCTATGVRTYTATATLDGATVTDKKTATIAKLPHSYSAAPTSWAWTSDNTSATATFKCANCTTTETRTATVTSVVKTPATCEVKGTTTYTASANSSTSSTKYNNTKDVQDIEALGHDYGDAIWTWTADGKSASAKIVCTHNSSHVLSGNAVVTSSVKNAATCTEKGTTTYSAKITLNGVQYTSTKDVQDIAMIAHSLTTKDNGNGTHTTTCSNCSYSTTGAHTYTDDYCSLCNAKDPLALYTLSDGTAYSQAEEVRYKRLTYSRNFKNTNWQALYVPFAMEYNDWSDKAEIYRIKNIFENDANDDGTVDEWVMRVIKLGVGSSTKPNTPYVIKPKAAGDMTLQTSLPTLYPAEEKNIWCASTDYSFYFTGTYQPMTVHADTYFALGGGALSYTTSDVALKAQRWYMEIRDKETGDLVPPLVFNNTNEVKSIRIFAEGEDDATSIHPIVRSESEHKSAIYNLNGQRISAPKKGIYIINGKKIMAK